MLFIQSQFWNFPRSVRKQTMFRIPFPVFSPYGVSRVAPKENCSVMGVATQQLFCFQISEQSDCNLTPTAYVLVHNWRLPDFTILPPSPLTSRSRTFFCQLKLCVNLRRENKVARPSSRGTWHHMSWFRWKGYLDDWRTSSASVDSRWIARSSSALCTQVRSSLVPVYLLLVHPVQPVA